MESEPSRSAVRENRYVPGGDELFSEFPLAEVALSAQSPDLLDEAEHDAVEAYALGGYEQVNRALRGTIPMTSSLERRIANIRSGLAKCPLPQPVRVTRETKAAIFRIADERSARALVYEEFAESGFMSTSGMLNPPHSILHVDPVILDLIVPAGTPVLRLGELAAVPDEREALVIDACRYLVIDVERDEARSYAIVMEGEP